MRGCSWGCAAVPSVTKTPHASRLRRPANAFTNSARNRISQVDHFLRKRASGDAYGLTARERRCSPCWQRDSSNRQIAADLVISEHTVARRVQNIFGKLGVTSRASAGAFAVAHQLV